MEWIFTKCQYYSEAPAAASLSPVSAVIWAMQEDGSHCISLTEILGSCQGAMWKDPFIQWSAVGALTGLRDYTTMVDRGSKSAVVSHIMFPDAQRIYGRNPGEKMKDGDML